VLFGVRDDTGVRVLAWRPVACDYASGPAYRLSLSDEAGLRRVLLSAATDSELTGMAPVGWYHSHTRGDLALRDDDLALHRQHFPENGQVAMVLRPDRSAATRTAVFVGRGEEMLPCSDAPAARRSGRGRRWPWIAAAAVAVLLAAGLWLRPAVSGIGLQVADHDGQLDIRWNRQARAITRAGSGFVEIADGLHRVRIDLDASQLRSGSVAYERTSAEATVRMVLRAPDGATVQEAAQFRGIPVPAGRR
jgi:hypothetical protein